MEMIERFSPKFLLLVLLLAAFASIGTGPARVFADDATDARHLVDRAQVTFEQFLTADEMGAFRDLLKNARGIFIAPQVLKGAFVFGVSGGSGVMLARLPGAWKWSGPAFYTIGELSFGFQIGGEASEIIVLAMTERGVNAMMGDSVKLGAGIDVAVGPVGIGAQASTANLSVDLLSFARSKGLYGGISIQGAVVKTRNDWNYIYYNRPATPVEILVNRKAENPQAAGLIQAVAKASGGR
jgi:lipid-binding SYLF domain-containing protein